jgi:type II secretory pathway pseudopilin PulG
MDLDNYHVIFKGEIVEGSDIEAVKVKLANCLQKDISTIDNLFSGKKIIIKKNAGLQSCLKIKKTFLEAGAICQIIKRKNGNPESHPANPVPSDEKKQNIRTSSPKHPPKTEKGPDEKYCESCGGTIKLNSRICAHCGISNQGRVNKKALVVSLSIILGIAIIGIITAIAIPQFISYRNHANIHSINIELQKIKDAQAQYFSDYHRYTDSLAALNIYITAPDIMVQILSADENCFQAKGTHLDTKVESWIDCNSADLKPVSTLSDTAGNKEDTSDSEGVDDQNDLASDKPIFTSSEGNFEVMFPDKPKYNVQAVQTPAGSIDIHFFMVEKIDYACIVGYSDYPAELMEKADHTKLLDGAANGAVNNINASISYQEDIDLDGYYGREIAFTIRKSFKMPKGGNGKARFFIADNRLYQILKIGTNVISDASTDNYLESFKILN